MKSTRIANLKHIVAWDEAEQRMSMSTTATSCSKATR